MYNKTNHFFKLVTKTPEAAARGAMCGLGFLTSFESEKIKHVFCLNHPKLQFKA